MIKEKSAQKTGTLYGVGVGPGDPELLTLKARRVLKDSKCVAVPRADSAASSLSLSIVEKAVGLEGKDLLDLVMPMTGDEEVLETAHKAAAREIAARLEKGSDVAFITVGDPLFFSTFGYIAPLVRKTLPGVSVEVVPGVVSFSAAAASAGLPVAEGDERVVIVPAVTDVSGLKGLFDDGFQTIVLMKVRRELDALVDMLVDLGLAENSVFVSRAGWDDEEVVRDIRGLKGRKVDYFSMIIVKAGR